MSLFDPQTFVGSVAATVVGAGIAWFVGTLSYRCYRFVSDRRQLEGCFASGVTLDAAAHKRQFATWPTSLRIHEGRQTILFGVMSRGEDLRLSHLNLRPIERAGGKWQNLIEPFALEFLKITCKQVEHERRGYSMQGLFNPWHDGKGGFDCLLQGNNFALEKGTAMWFEIEIEARRGWSGAIGLRANVLNGPQLWCRRDIEVVGDGNAFN